MLAIYDAYLANNLGFSTLGRYVLDALILPRLEITIGLSVFEPFRGCDEELSPHLTIPFGGSYRELERHYLDLNERIPACNRQAIERSRLFLAVLDGHDIGVAWECGYWSGLKRGPAHFVMTDFRPCENLATGTNSMITGGLAATGGGYFQGTNALDQWFEAIAFWKKESDTTEKGGRYDPRPHDPFTS